jgi:hypothetical protein
LLSTQRRKWKEQERKGTLSNMNVKNLVEEVQFYICARKRLAFIQSCNTKKDK